MLFELVELGPGVHAAVSDIAGAAVGNAAIIDLGDKTLVIDSFMTAQAARELRTEVTRLTGRSAFMLVNTHWHGMATTPGATRSLLTSRSRARRGRSS